MNRGHNAKADFVTFFNICLCAHWINFCFPNEKVFIKISFQAALSLFMFMMIGVNRVQFVYIAKRSN